MNNSGWRLKGFNSFIQFFGMGQLDGWENYVCAYGQRCDP